MLRLDAIFANAAPWQANATLAIEVAMGLVLFGGTVLARRRQYRAHGWCQSAVVLLNLAVISINMIPSFTVQLAPKIPRGLRRSYYGIGAAHAAVGGTAELLGIYLVMAAGTRLLPTRLTVQNLRPWMRAALALWWSALLLGIATYFRWYVRS